jgi:hypothetical protein
MFSQLTRRGTVGLSSAQRRVMPLLASKDKSNSFSRREALKALEQANRQASRRGLPVAVRHEDIERLALHQELSSLAAVQRRAIADDRERYASQRHKQTGHNVFDDEPQEHPDDAQPPSSSAKMRYEDINASSGNSALQEWFDDLVYRALLKHCPPTSDAVRPSTLLQFIRKEVPSFSFREHCDGMPFSLLIKNCCYLQSFGGRVSFLPVRREDFTGNDDSFESTQEFLHDSTIVGLRKFKMREQPSVDGIRQGPQPWLHDAGMVPRKRRK